MGSETVAARQSDLSLDLFFGEDQPVRNKFHISDVNVANTKRNTTDDNDEHFDSNDITAEEEEVSDDKKLKEYMQHICLTSNQEENGEEASLDEDDKAETEEQIYQEGSKIFRRMAKKITIESDIEEVDEEMEESASSGGANMFLTSSAEMLSTEELLIQARSKLMFRAASVLEQRLKTISDLKDLFQKRKKLEFKNRFLNDKCSEYLKKTTTVNNFESTAGALSIHGNQRYYNVLEEFTDMKSYYDKTKPLLELETQNLTDSYYISRSRFEQVFGDFMSRELEVGSECIDSKTGKLLNEQKLGSMVKKQQKRFDQLGEVRVFYLKLHNRLDDIHKNLRTLNFMGEGHTLMEYEHLVIMNNISMDKLDEREEELQRLRDKCTEDVSILSYMKKNFEAFIHDIMEAAMNLEEVTEKKKTARSLLAVQRLKRDFLRKASLKIHSTTGLLTSPGLLRKMDLDSHALDALKRQVDKFSRDTVNLTKDDNVNAESETNGKGDRNRNPKVSI